MKCTMALECTRYIRVGILRDVTRFLKSDWFALYAVPGLVRRRGSARLYTCMYIHASTHIASAHPQSLLYICGHITEDYDLKKRKVFKDIRGMLVPGRPPAWERG